MGRLQRVFLTHSRAPLFRTLHPVHRRKSDITTTLPALRRHALATALLRRINRRTQRTTSATRLVFRTTGPTAVVAISALMCCDIDARGFPWSGASLEVLVPCNARWLRSRCPGRPASGRSRFGVSHHPSTRAPSLQGDLPTRWIFIRPCGFPLERIRCDAARVADALSTVRCVPIESVARAARVGPMGPVPPSVSAGRRSVALTSRVFDRTCR